MIRPAPPPRREAGFTLVEMLVALSIFALLASAGVGLLRSSVDLQGVVDAKLDEGSDIERLHGLFSGDVGQAIARPEVGVGEARQPSFEGTAGEMRFVRAGWSNLDQSPRSSLQQVTWRLGPGGVERTGSIQLDGGGGDTPAVLARKASRLSLRYRRADGRWVSAFVSDRRELLPAAIEMTIATPGRPPLVIAAALPPRGREPEPSGPRPPAEEAAT